MLCDSTGKRFPPSFSTMQFTWNRKLLKFFAIFPQECFCRLQKIPTHATNNRSRHSQPSNGIQLDQKSAFRQRSWRRLKFLDEPILLMFCYSLKSMTDWGVSLRHHRSLCQCKSFLLLGMESSDAALAPYQPTTTDAALALRLVIVAVLIHMTNDRERAYCILVCQITSGKGWSKGTKSSIPSSGCQTKQLSPSTPHHFANKQSIHIR